MSKEHALHVDLEGMTCSLLLQLQHTNQCVCEGCKVYLSSSEKQLFISNMNPNLIGRCVMMHFTCTAECKQVADIESGNKVAYIVKDNIPKLYCCGSITI